MTLVRRQTNTPNSTTDQLVIHAFRMHDSSSFPDTDHLKVGRFARVQCDLRERLGATSNAVAIRVRYHAIYQFPAMGRNKTGQYRDPFLAVTLRA